MLLQIGELAKRAGVRPSAVRYYEERGLIEPQRRHGGKRVYDEKSVERLTLIVFAKSLGFSLDDIRKLLLGFPDEMPAGARWSHLAQQKLAALDVMSQQIDTMRAALHKISRCGCRDLEQCAHALAAKHCRP